MSIPSIQSLSISYINSYGTPKTSLLIENVFAYLDLRGISRCSKVCKKWKQLAQRNELYLFMCSKISMNSEMKDMITKKSWELRDLSYQVAVNGTFDEAISICKKSAEIDPHNGAYGFRDLCSVACKNKKYDTALRCQRLSKYYNFDAGNESMSHIIQMQTQAPHFLEIGIQLGNQALELIKEDREYGLKALMAIAKKFADLRFFDTAMSYTHLAFSERHSRQCYRGRNHDDDVKPFAEMGYYMLNLKQYSLAEECAKHEDKSSFIESYLLVAIFAKQLKEEKIINKALLESIKPETLPWIQAYEGLVFELINQDRMAEATVYAQKRVEIKWEYNKTQFVDKLKEFGIILK